MAVGRSVWEVVKGIFIAVGKLLYLTGKLVICLFLLVLHLFWQCSMQGAGNRKGIDRCIGYGTDRIQMIEKRR